MINFLNFLKANWFYILVVIAAFVYPFTGPSRYMLNFVVMCLVMSIGASSLNLILGYTGQASLAHGAFFGIGAYAVALLTYKVGINFWLALLLAGIITMAIGTVIGLPTLRTKGSYFAISTLAFGVIVEVVAGAWINLTGGYTGLTGLPRPSPFNLFGMEIKFTELTTQYYVVLIILIITVLVLHRIVYSIQGYDFMAIRNNDVLAEAVGINTFASKMKSFAATNFFAAIAGGLYILVMGTVSPEVVYHTHTFAMLIYVLVGGIATLSGPIIGAFVLSFLTEYLHNLGDFRLIIFGLILIVVIIYFPRGLMGGYSIMAEKIKTKLEQRKGGGIDVAES